ELKNPGNDGFKVSGLDKDGKRVYIKSIKDIDKFFDFELVNEAKDKVDVASLSIGNTYKDNKGYPVKVIDIKGTGNRWKVTYQHEDGKKKTVSTSLDKGINLYESVNESNKISDDKLMKLIPKLPKGYVGKNTGVGVYYILTPDGGDIVLTQSKDKKNWSYRPSILASKILAEAYSGFLRNPEDPDSEKFEPTGAVAEFREELRALFGKFKGDLKNPEFIKGVAQIMVNWKSLLRSQLDEATVNYDFSKEELIRVIKQLKRGASTEIGMIKAFETALGRELSDDEIRGFKLNEAKKKKAKKNNKKLNKPMRDSSGGKAYKVYVKDPKTKKIKTVRFGSGGLRAKINDKKARNAFAKRHNCAQKKDKTKAGYWSCRLPRYAKLLGLKSNFGGFW
ncbi:MAG: hypothetical protein GY793_09410, partial [Proteobacteria bacterium]|nr:hypothetical protein [Pseudomonadota bacterium]